MSAEKPTSVHEEDGYFQHERPPRRSHTCWYVSEQYTELGIARAIYRHLHLKFSKFRKSKNSLSLFVLSGCCCDTRTACMAVNVISLGFAALGLVSLAPQLDRPGYERFGLLIAAFVIGIICNTLGLWGSLRFRKIGILIAAIWFGIEAVLSIVLFMDFVGATIAICFLYPHIVFFRELQNGIMSRETYADEKDCCGCV